MMTIQDKLSLIQQLGGLTQEKLAQKLDVSFSTVNSWVNGKSVPYRHHQQRINVLCTHYAGHQKIQTDILSEKKQILAVKRKTYKDPLKIILSRPDLYDQFILSLTYNTNKIEGSTLTEPETAAILFGNAALSNKTMIEQMEVKNHQAALGFLFQNCRKGNRITETLILKLHGMLLNGIRDDAGMYRRHGVRIVGADVPTANYLKVPSFMKDLIKNVDSKRKDTIDHCAQIHSHFEQIHPFSDGNGRIGRLVMHAMLFAKNFPPAVIKQERKRKYLSTLNAAQRKSDFEGLQEVIADAVLEACKIIELK